MTTERESLFSVPESTHEVCDFAALRELHTWLEMECVWPSNAAHHAQRWTDALEAAIAAKPRCAEGSCNHPECSCWEMP